MAIGSGLGTGVIVGILIVVFFLLLVGVDVTCYFLNKCGLLMCIAVNFCGKTGPGAKSKDIEEGKAAFTSAPFYNTKYIKILKKCIKENFTHIESFSVLICILESIFAFI